MKMRNFLSSILILGITSALNAASILNPVDMKPYNNQIAALSKTAKHIEFFNSETGKSEKKINLKQTPNSLLIDGDTAYVATGGPRGTVEIIDLKSGKIKDSIAVGHTPMSPVKSGDTLYVANRFTGTVSIIDLKKNKVIKTIEAVREPVALSLSPDGKTLWIANHLPNGPSDGEFTASELTKYENGKTTSYPLSNGTQGVRGMHISPDGKWLAITHVLSRYQVPTTQLDRGWINTNAVTLIDIEKPDIPYSVLLDDVDYGAANPWAVEFTEDGKKLVTTQAGTHEITVIDFPALIEKIKQSAAENKSVNRLSFMDGLRQRIKLPLNGPRSMTIKGDTAYVGGYFSDNIAKVTLDPSHKIDSWDEGIKVEKTKQQLGEQYFNDAGLCFQAWESCASCHPDSRVDALNWDLMNDGLGNPKNTRTMFLSHHTPPVMTLGIRKNAEYAVRAGFRHIQFVEPEEHVSEAVDEYLSKMPVVASPFLSTKEMENIECKEESCNQCHAKEVERGVLTESAKKGKQIFKEAGCIDCHKHPYFTTKPKRELVNTGTTKGLDEGKPVVVPPLVEVWRTGPYMHDGRAKTLEEVITIHNPGDKRGKTTKLNKAQIKDLVEYLKSL